MGTAALSILAARTHPPEYRLHKYWSRKPANVVRSCLSSLLDAPGVVVDPCCGSGVVVREAGLLGHTVFAADVNPVAVELSDVTSSPPDPAAFREAAEAALGWFEGLCAPHWRLAPGDERRARYVVHAVVVRCRGCGREVAAADEALRVTGRRCPGCGAPLRFNLEWLDHTQPRGVAVEGEAALVTERGVLAAQAAASDRPTGPVSEALRAALAPNRRILAFEGMAVRELFTPRNLGLLAALAERLGGLVDGPVRRAALLWLTASVAQCSRLIPFRHNLRTGGPAWSVPGFWVPPLHLETNPAIHLRARLARFTKGLEGLAARRPALPPRISRTSADTLLASLRRDGTRADVVFLDPPYGDSVPFVEFSALWNAFLGVSVDAGLDMSVSDRQGAQEGWRRYADSLRRLVAGAAGVLGPEGVVLLTFNNHDLRAWRALIEALHGEGLGCDEVVYQIPAVISSKAAFHPQRSYVGDLWSVWSRRDASWRPGRDVAPALAALERCAEARGGVIAPNLARRTLAVAWMAHELAAELVTGWDGLLASRFTARADGHLVLKRERAVAVAGDDPQPPPAATPSLARRVREAARATLAEGPRPWTTLYEEVARRCLTLGLPDPTEVRALLEGLVVIEGRRCHALPALSGRPFHTL